jgi:urea carboxylase
MLHSEPRFSPAGDAFIEIELGDEMSFDLNVKVQALAHAIREARVEGVVELVPELASLLLSYDPDRIAYDDVVAEIKRIFAWQSGDGVPEMPSRLFYVALFYFDPWTEECVADYRKTYPDKVPDPELLCQANGLADRAALQRIHSGTEYWVAALGFWPGLCSLMPLDPRCRITAPKYNPPRAWTPKGTIGVGGGLTSMYPDRTPGGYQIFARTPMPIWDKDQRLAAFKDSLALFRPGDRVRFTPIGMDEFEYIDAKVEEGTYQHPMIDYQVFSVARYRGWLCDLDKE